MSAEDEKTGVELDSVVVAGDVAAPPAVVDEKSKDVGVHNHENGVGHTNGHTDGHADGHTDGSDLKGVDGGTSSVFIYFFFF